MIILLLQLNILFFLERESKNRRNYLFTCKNSLLLFPAVGTDFCIRSAKSWNDNDIDDVPAKQLTQSI